MKYKQTSVSELYFWEQSNRILNVDIIRASLLTQYGKWPKESSDKLQTGYLKVK